MKNWKTFLKDLRMASNELFQDEYDLTEVEK